MTRHSIAALYYSVCDVSGCQSQDLFTGVYESHRSLDALFALVAEEDGCAAGLRPLLQLSNISNEPWVVGWIGSLVSHLISALLAISSFGQWAVHKFEERGGCFYFSRLLEFKQLLNNPLS